MNDVRLSKFLSLVLRHRPDEAGLTLDDHGWADLAAVCEVAKNRFGATESDIRRIVSESDKQRFIIEGMQIRANQGHSVDVNLDLKPARPPETLYHGTVQDASASISAKGLVRGNRHHVHLSADSDTARRVAIRRNRPWLIYHIDAAAMTNSGHLFYCSVNGVWLTDHVPPEFLSTEEPE